MTGQGLLKTVSSHMPVGLRSIAKRVYFSRRHWAHPAMRKFGTVQDLYYWVADGDLDTLLLIQNYFSVLYPSLRTETEGRITIHGKDGTALGEKAFSVGHHGCPRFRVSSLLEELQVSGDHSFGTLDVNIAIPREVLGHIQTQKSIYFWDRFYIGYTNSRGQTCFHHGVDKTYIYREGSPKPIEWYKKRMDRQWAPEIPINIHEYKKFNVIMINRTARSADMRLILLDTEDNSKSWDAQVPPKGLHRFELTAETTQGLQPKELRMRIEGMATRFGRPVVFKEFHNGAISAMHC